MGSSTCGTGIRVCVEYFIRPGQTRTRAWNQVVSSPSAYSTPWPEWLAHVMSTWPRGVQSELALGLLMELPEKKLFPLVSMSHWTSGRKVQSFWWPSCHTGCGGEGVTQRIKPIQRRTQLRNGNDRRRIDLARLQDDSWYLQSPHPPCLTLYSCCQLIIMTKVDIFFALKLRLYKWCSLAWQRVILQASLWGKKATGRFPHFTDKIPGFRGEWRLAEGHTAHQ